MKKIWQVLKVLKKEFIWAFILVLFFLICFSLIGGEWNEFPLAISLLLYSYFAGGALVARYAYRRRYERIKSSRWKIWTLFPLIIFSYLYMFSIEIVANIDDFLNGTQSFQEHMTYHIYNNTWNIILSSIFAWLVFQKFNPGFFTAIGTFIAGLIFCFLSPNLFGSGGQEINNASKVGNAFFFIWVFHFTWAYVVLLMPKKKSN